MFPRRTPALLALAATLAAGGPPADAKDVPAAYRVVLLGPAAGPSSVAADEAFDGVRAAFAETEGREVRVEGDRRPLGDPAGLAAELAACRKAGAVAIVAHVPDGATAALEREAEKAKLPLLVISPEASRPDLDPARAVFWAGGLRPADEGLAAMDFLLQPLGSRTPAVLHDGSARGAQCAAKAVAQAHVAQTPRAPQVLAPGFSAADAASLAASGADAVLYFGGAEGAERLLAAARDAKLGVPVLLGQGLASGAVPSFADGRAPNAWALEAAYFEDHGGPGADAIAALAAAAPGSRSRAGSVRGYRAGRFLADALAAAGAAQPKKLVPALRALARDAARGRPVFEDWGHASLARLEPWRADAVREDPACHRVRATLMPIAGMPQIGFFPTSRFQWEPGTFYVQCTFDEGDRRTIERDLRILGLHSGGYESELESRIVDDLLGRAMSKLHRLFRRNPDGTAIPGVSFRISFGTAPAPAPKGVKSSQKWTMLIAGDDPAAGGRASGNTAWVFSTFLQRTIYVPHRITPPISATDRPYLAGTYRWGTSVEENLRGDTVRSLLDGFTQGMALTGAHELGHLAGCGHDEASPRSIMNVAEAVGLDFDWAEWIPAHLDILTTRIGVVPVE